MNWLPDGKDSFALIFEGDVVAAVSKIDREGRRGWYWHSFVSGAEGFFDTLEQSQADAEKATTSQRRH